MNPGGKIPFSLIRDGPRPVALRQSSEDNALLEDASSSRRWLSMLLVLRVALIVGLIAYLSPWREAAETPSSAAKAFAEVPLGTDDLRLLDELWGTLPPETRRALIAALSQRLRQAPARPEERSRVLFAEMERLGIVPGLPGGDTLRPEDRQPPWRGAGAPRS